MHVSFPSSESLCRSSTYRAGLAGGAAVHWGLVGGVHGGLSGVRVLNSGRGWVLDWVLDWVSTLHAGGSESGCDERSGDESVTHFEVGLGFEVKSE